MQVEKEAIKKGMIINQFASVMESYIENDSGNVHGYIQENNIHFNVLNKIKIFGGLNLPYQSAGVVFAEPTPFQK